MSPKLRGLKAFRFAGAIRTLAHLLRRALTFILDVTYTMGQPGQARPENYGSLTVQQFLPSDGPPLRR